MIVCVCARVCAFARACAMCVSTLRTCVCVRAVCRVYACVCAHECVCVCQRSRPSACARVSARAGAQSTHMRPPRAARRRRRMARRGTPAGRPGARSARGRGVWGSKPTHVCVCACVCVCITSGRLICAWTTRRGARACARTHTCKTECTHARTLRTSTSYPKCFRWRAATSPSPPLLPGPHATSARACVCGP